MSTKDGNSMKIFLTSVRIWNVQQLVACLVKNRNTPRRLFWRKTIPDTRISCEVSFVLCTPPSNLSWILESLCCLPAWDQDSRFQHLSKESSLFQKNASPEKRTNNSCYPLYSTTSINLNRHTSRVAPSLRETFWTSHNSRGFLFSFAQNTVKSRVLDPFAYKTTPLFSATKSVQSNFLHFQEICKFKDF